MNILHRYEGKNLDILKEQYLKELGVSSSDLYIITTEEEAGLFKGKKYIVEVLTKEDIKKAIKEFMIQLGKNMGIDINSEIRIEDHNINILLVTSNNNIMIGKEGKTLNSIQIVLKQSLQELNRFNLKINLDVGDYKAKKIKNLEREVKNICKEVLKTKVEVKLDPMNSYERRKVHSIVGEFENLQSISYGEEPNRYTVIKIKD